MKLLDMKLTYILSWNVVFDGVSFNGRTEDSGSFNWGSNPCTPANLLNISIFYCFLKMQRKTQHDRKNRLSS